MTPVFDSFGYQLLSFHLSFSYSNVPTCWDISSFDTSIFILFWLHIFDVSTTTSPLSGPPFTTLNVLVPLTCCHNLSQSPPWSNPIHSHLCSSAGYECAREIQAVVLWGYLGLLSRPLLSPMFCTALSPLSLGAISDVPTHSSDANPTSISSLPSSSSEDDLVSYFTVNTRGALTFLCPNSLR